MKELLGTHAVEIDVATLFGRVLSCGMGDTQEQDQYEERLKEVFNSFDASGSGSLCPEELSDLCQSLHLDDATPALLHILLQSQDRLTARVDFDQFKNALILVLSSTLEPPQAEPETLSKPDSPEIQPKFVKGSKRYGRRSTPEFVEPMSDFCEVTNENPVEVEEDLEDNYDSAVPRKRERWNANESSTEEYEAEGQMHLWNPDEPSTPRKAIFPLSTCLEERLREACDELEISWDGCAGHTQLLALCEHLGLEINLDVLQSLTGDGVMNVQEFVSRVVNHNKPPTPSASTPYRQLKRHHSTQPFDDGGRRIATTFALTSTIGMRLFSTLDDGTGFTPVECILDAWLEEGIENSLEILQALNFSLDGKLSLGDLTMALENELLVTKNGIHQAALASFKAEIRYLLERVDRELREKEKLQSDLEKAEKLKTQLATEVDERHSAIEHMNNLSLRKLEQDHKEKLAAVRSELTKEMDQIQQQASLQRKELESEVEKIREDESFLRDHLSISVKENRRLEMELLDITEKLVETQSQNAKLQTSLDNVMKEKFGDLDPGSADFLLQEERIKELRSSYEAQCRELQDRIDEMQSELREFHGLGRVHQPCQKPLSEELESKSPGMESDPGIGCEEVQPFSMSLEAEMMLEQLKEQHLQEMEDLQNQLESKISEFEKMIGEQRATHEEQLAALALQYQQEVEALRGEMVGIQSRGQELQNQLEQAELERTSLEQKQAQEREELENRQEEEVGALRQKLLEAHTCTADLEEQLKTLEALQTETDGHLVDEMDALRKQHAGEIKKLGDEHAELSEARLEEERKKLREEQAELEKRLLDSWEREKELLQQSHEAELKARLEEAKARFEEERDEIVQRLTEQWQEERAQLDEQNNETLHVALEEEISRLAREQEEKEGELREQWESERGQLQVRQEQALLDRILQERLQMQEKFEQREMKLKEEWERERLQLEEDYEGMLQDRLNEEKEQRETEKEEEEKRVKRLMAEERDRLEENHCEAMKDLTDKHTRERDALSSMLDKLREDIAHERRETEMSFTQRIKEVESRFSGDQESVAQRLQTNVLKLEQHYQIKLKALSERLGEQELSWEAQMQEALANAEDQRRMMEEAKEQEMESLDQEWTKRQHELESLHQEEMEELVLKNQRLQNELDDFISVAQTKELALSKQLNDLHNRLQGSLDTKDELLAQSEKKALETELLLNQMVADFKQEREELLCNNSELEAKYTEMLSISERQITERIELLTERDDFKMKIEELETLLRQAAVDFEFERRELQEHTSILVETLEDNQENDREELIAERDALKIRMEALEMELRSVLSFVEKAKEEEIKELNDKNTSMEEGSTFFSEEQETCLTPPKSSLNNAVLGYSSNQEVYSLSPFLVEQGFDVETLTAAPDAVDGGPDNIKNIDKEYDENMHATSEAQGDNTAEFNEVFAVPVDYQIGDSSPEKGEGDPHVGCCSVEIGHEHPGVMSCDVRYPDSPVPYTDNSSVNCNNKAVFPEMRCEVASSPEASEGGDAEEVATDCETKVAPESCEKESKPQDVQTLQNESTYHEDVPCHETVVYPSVLADTGDPDERPLVDAEVGCLQNNSHDRIQEVELVSDSDSEQLTDEMKDVCTCDCLESLDEDADWGCSPPKLQALYYTATEENILLHEKISLLQQKTEILENLLAHNTEKLKTGNQILEENHSLKVKVLLLMEHVKELEVKALKMTAVQIRYEDCMCENNKLKEQNSELEKRVWSLESRMNIFYDFQDRQITLVDEISRIRGENRKLSELFSELEREGEILSALHPDAEQSESPTEESLLDKVPAFADLKGSCEEFEKQNTKLRRAITELQDESHSLNETTLSHRSEASRLAEENVILKQKIAALKEEDVKEVQEELIQTLEHLKKGKIAAQKAAESFKKQISELRLQSQQFEDKNVTLSEKNAQNISDMENLRQQLAELMKENERREVYTAEEKNKLAACVSSLEAELTKALEDTVQLEQRNTQLSLQLAGLREKAVKVDSMESQLSHLMEEGVSTDKKTQGLCNQLARSQERIKMMDDTLQALNHQSVRLKSDLHVLQQEGDSLKLEVSVLHKQLQNVNDKNHILEMALHSSGLQSQSKKLYRDKMSRLVDQEQQLLRQENERLQAEVRNAKGDLMQSREKVRQLDATMLSLKQHKPQSQSALVKALEQENASLKQELEAQKELTKGREAGQGHAELEGLQHENEALRAQMARLSTQLLETFQVQLVGLLPPSPHRMPRGQHRGEDPDNMQDERERKMKNMAERMREIELSLHNVKLLLKEKVVQLKDQLHKNSKADVLISDLYEENTQLMKALERTEQRQKMAEKKNYLLEEKISSLNKIVRDLNPSPLPPLPYHYKYT
ncbi:ninein isoform X1 [Etheostoma spectabile]|uniref:ninein isoform X1 n=2 Tax=Etheostoma spectabile TaxID=54343 RepID=UPI0013AF0358|nr:ninein isoform X1 [Etheostoma spectabile]